MKVSLVDTGTKFRPDHYTMKLFRALNRHSSRSWSFEVITSSVYPSWWGKMDIMLSRDRFVYLDLDTVICGDANFLFDYTGDFCIRRNPWPGAWCDASLMSISPKVGAEIAKRFFDNPKRAMRNYRSDQEFIAEIIPQADTWQDIAPGKTKSFKADQLNNGPDGASIVAFHGEPKPHQLPADHWVREYWQ